MAHNASLRFGNLDGRLTDADRADLARLSGTSRLNDFDRGRLVALRLMSTGDDATSAPPPDSRWAPPAGGRRR